MKIIKIICGILAALLALAYVTKIITGFSHNDAPLASSHALGAVAGFLIVTAVSITLFRSAFKT